MLEYFSALDVYYKAPFITSHFRITDGQVEAFGDNSSYQLGLPFKGTIRSYTPVPIPIYVVKIAQYSSYSYAIGKDGELYVCGSTSYTCLGAANYYDGYVKEFTKVEVPEKISRVAIASCCTFVIGREGRLYACGLFLTESQGEEERFTLFPLPSLVVNVKATGFNVFATLENGEIWTWNEGKKLHLHSS